MAELALADGSVAFRNLTARRIAICDKAAPDTAVMLPAFGERVLSADQAARYDYEPWTSQQLVRVERVDARSRTSSGALVSIACFVSGYSFLATLLIGGWWLVTRASVFGVVAVFGIIVTLASAGLAGWHGDAWSNMARSLNIFVGLVLSFGAPGVAILFTAANVDLRLDAAPQLPLALVIAWLFIGMASALPAALFLFFYRQKVPTLRENFLRDVVRLDPNVQTLVDAEISYDGLIRDVFGSGASGASSRGRLPILGTTGVIAGLWIWVLIPGLPGADDIRGVLVPEPDIVSFTFLGAYVFAVNMLFRRYTRADLGPKAYTHIMIRIFVAVASTWVLSFAPFARSDGDPVALMLMLAFFIGIIPETGTAIVQDLLQRWEVIGRAVPSMGESHPLSRLDGISLYDRAHLLEAGIENVESLAHHNLIELMLWTRIPTARLVDFVDQAILYLHLRGPVDASRDDGDAEEARRLLGRYGIRAATDLERAYALASARSNEDGERLLALVDSPGTSVHRLRVVMDAMEDDQWMVHIRNWRDQSSLGAPVRSVEEFVQLSAIEAGRATSAASTSTDDAQDGERPRERQTPEVPSPSVV
jgi:hypothetical protein